MSNLRIATADDLHHAAEAIRNAPRVAVDTEFHAERRYWPRLYLVQVHVPGEGTWLIDPTREGREGRISGGCVEATAKAGGRRRPPDDLVVFTVSAATRGVASIHDLQRV